ncbi:MAG: single-stranded DNA-binding protein [Patescibacteria group bacterium]
MNLNKAYLIGNLTRDPELRTIPSGTSVCSFGLATNRVWTNPSGEKQQEAQFHNIVVFGKQAETVQQYLKKGSMALVEGRIQTRNWEAQDGSKRNRTEIVAERIQFGPRKEGTTNSNPANPTPNSTNSNIDTKDETLDTIEYPEENNNPDEIPF